MKILIILAIAVTTAYGQKHAGAFECPSDKYALYPDEHQCDKYYECDLGEYEEHLCEDGLRFDARIRRFNQCDLPINVDCGTRTELQPAQSNHFCPRKNGYFAHPDPQICRVYYNCIQGNPTESTCPVGLHFVENLGICVWENTSNRTDCHELEVKLPDGFECPPRQTTDKFGLIIAHPVFPHPTDCQKFYVCLNGIEPRQLQCGDGQAFNEDNGRCDDPENVDGCEEWYKDEEKPPATAAKQPKQRR